MSNRSETTERLGVNRACSRYLNQIGEASARTCRACGLGPCRNVLDEVALVAGKHNTGSETTEDRLAKALWNMVAPMLSWPQSAVTWDRMTEEGRDAWRSRAAKLMEAEDG